ncbi:hypothetical protein [Lentibacillus salicampi]|uniref:Uncharacterized protein n=1 Tax=Lentibacillus salicampi TaxID=175306 RepID=A0A4Y9ACH1_9BACI|nr:hypothetical protein [Lentibacillus salicampi]TFJ93598.1 hypothetical protein E4U82_06470 [Lentibacillus salicampi]
MVVFVENCFHWIGFHIMNDLLDNGFQVDGMDSLDTDKKEHLSMFVGRNQLFRHVSASERNNAYDISLKIEDDALILEKENLVTIHLPLVFGEWMPMNQEGVYDQDDFIPFDSERFLTEAVYVGDVLKSLQQWFATSDLPPILEVRSFHERQTGQRKLENAVYIRNNRPIQEEINRVKKHYNTYQKFYQ